MTESSENHQPSSSTFRRVLATPLRRLIRGQVSDYASYQEVIDEADLDPSLAEALGLRIRKVGGCWSARIQLAKSLIPICKKQLADGRSAEELAGTLENADRKPRGVAWKTHLQTLLESRLPTNAIQMLAELAAWNFPR